MHYFLSPEQEEILDSFLNEENQKILNQQLSSNEVPDDIKELLKAGMESGTPIPLHDTKYGYYSLSFTPCDYGVRIYAHHHITDVSKKLFDPSIDGLDIQEVVVNTGDK